METLEGRERILREAERLFAEHGYRGVSIRDIAHACGMTNAALYYHFSSKEDLFLNMLRHNLRQRGAVLKQAAEEGTSCRDQVTRLVTAYLQLAVEHKTMFHQSARDIMDLAEPVHKIWREARDWLINLIGEILCGGQAAGQVREDVDIRAASFALMGLANSLIIYQTAYEEPDLEPGRVNAVVGIFFRGVGIN
jgi:AcrR family transcriptional regulator